MKRPGSVPGSRRPPGRGNGNPLQYSCLENPVGRGTWWAAVRGVANPSDSTQQLNFNRGPFRDFPVVPLSSPGGSVAPTRLELGQVSALETPVVSGSPRENRLCYHHCPLWGG